MPNCPKEVVASSGALCVDNVSHVTTTQFNVGVRQNCEERVNEQIVKYDDANENRKRLVLHHPLRHSRVVVQVERAILVGNDLLQVVYSDQHRNERY